jgi:DNA-binding transcriptional regulator YhcF (GntR family)
VACSLCSEGAPLQRQFGAFCLWRPKNRFPGAWEGTAETRFACDRDRLRTEADTASLADALDPASVVAVQAGETRAEVGLIGCEGMSGTSVVLGAQSSPHESYMQVAGEAQQITTSDLQRAMAASKSLHLTLLRYVQVFMVQTAHSAIANARAKIDERLARWILMAHDRVAGDTLPLTHEFIALMLGVRRAGVTEAVHTLSSKGLIETRRGEIVVRNRKGIERHAGDAYGTPEAEYRRLIGTFSEGRSS